MLLLNNLNDYPENSIEHFYVIQDEYEVIEGDLLQVKLDGFQEKDFSLFNDNNPLEVYEKISTYRFTIELSGNLAAEWKRRYKINFNARRWLKIHLTDTPTNIQVNQIQVDFQADSEAEAITRYIADIDFLPPRGSTYQQLKRAVAWDDIPLASTAQIEAALNRFAHEDVFVNIYNVGQGSLGAIVNSNNTPLAYLDLGGGFKFNKFTYPTTLRLCHTEASTVIISHWDFDHLETAIRYNRTGWNNTRKYEWIVPQQQLTPTYKKLAKHIQKTATLLVWPTWLKKVKVGNCEIVKCNGPDKNHSGLAVIVNSKKSEIKKVLYPGDAAYKYLPKRATKDVDGLVATHHGANFDDNNSPIPLAKKGAIVYSYGSGTRYGHPKAAAVDAHLTSGWNNRLDTINGNISFNKSKSPCHNTECEQAHCDLHISQMF